MDRQPASEEAMPKEKRKPSEDVAPKQQRKPMDSLSERVIAAAVEVHRFFGPGHVDYLYQDALCRELELQGVGYEEEVPIAVNYKGTVIDCAAILELVVDKRVIVQVTALDEIPPLRVAQLRSYLKFTDYEAGLFINFNVPLLKHGVRRVSRPKSERKAA
jgi:GxxExxY protein